jgi:hypothetical protein
MNIRLNEKEHGEMIFSWKEIWTLVKKRKLTFSQDFLDQLIVTLLKLKATIKEKNVDKTNK